MIKIILFTILFSVLLSGCVKPDEEKMGPFPNNYKSIVKNFVGTNFFDPYSLRDVSISKPFPGFYLSQQGWAVCIKANAKNRMGAYTGMSHYEILINRGKVIHSDDEYAIPCLGDNVSYEPWPEMDAGR